MSSNAAQLRAWSGRGTVTTAACGQPSDFTHPPGAFMGPPLDRVIPVKLMR